MVRDIEEIAQKFDEYTNSYSGFEDTDCKRSKRRDLHALIILDKWFPGTANIVAAVEHDQMHLGINIDHILSLTDEQIIELCRARVYYNEEYDCLSMNV